MKKVDNLFFDVGETMKYFETFSLKLSVLMRALTISLHRKNLKTTFLKLNDELKQAIRVSG